MGFNLSEKIALLNKLSKDTLTLTHYTDWELGSYGEGSLFRQDGLIGYVRANDFTECIDKTLKLVKGRIANV